MKSTKNYIDKDVKFELHWTRRYGVDQTTPVHTLYVSDISAELKATMLLLADLVPIL
jgi:hypothetical protein